MKNRIMLKDLKYYLSILITLYCLSPFSLFADTYSYNLTDGDLYIWDLSGNYLDRLLGMDVSYDINHDERGFLSGSRDITGFDADNGLQIKMILSVRGFVRQRNGVATVILFLTGRGTAADDFKEYRLSYSKRITGTINPDLLAIEGNASERVLITGFNSFNETFDVSIDLPPGVDGSSFLSIDVNEDGRRLVGSSVLKLSTNRTFTLDSKGIYNPRTNASRLSLNGNGCRIISEIESDSSLLSLKGVVLGQSLMCSSSIIDTPLVMKTVGTSGGTVTESGGTSVSIPPGALSEDKLITVVTHRDRSSLPAPLTLFAGSGQFEPHGLIFKEPVTITIPLTSAMPPGLELPIAYYDEEKESWLLMNFPAVVNSDGLSASAEIMHFSFYALPVRVYAPGSESLMDMMNDIEKEIGHVSYFDLFDDVRNRLFNHFNIGSQLPCTFGSIEEFGDLKEICKYQCWRYVAIDLVINWTTSTVKEVVDGDGNRTNIYIDEISDSKGERYDPEDYLLLDPVGCGLRVPLQYEFEKLIDDKRHHGVISMEAYLRCGVPELKLEVNENRLCTDDTIYVRASVICGNESMKSQKIDIGVEGPGDIDLTTGYTLPDGKPLEILFTALDPAWFGTETATIFAEHTACVDQYEETEVRTSMEMEVPQVASVEIKPSSKVMEPGESHIFKGIAKDKNGNEIKCDTGWIWSSGNSSIADVKYVQGNRKVTANSYGTTTITAMLQGVSGTATVTVEDGLRLEFEPNNTCLLLGETVQMTATVLDEEDEPQFDIIYSWGSSNKNVVSIDPITGIATATGIGSASIVARATTTEGATLSATAEFSVSSVRIEPRQHELGVHGGYQLKAILLDKEDRDGTPVLEITPYIIPWDYGRPLPAIYIPYEDPNFIPSDEYPSGYLYSNPVSYKLITWSSSDESVATVNKYGHVHGVSEGQATISATALPGSDWEEVGCATVTVVKKPAINSQMEFYGTARNCYYNLQPGTTPHPLDFKIYWQGSDLNLFTMEWGGAGAGIKVLLAGTNIGLIHNPAEINLSHPVRQEFTFLPGFKILLWAPETFPSFTICGGHRYAAVQHTGYVYISPEEPERPIFNWYLFEDYLDAPEGFHLKPICAGDDCALGAIDYPEWDPKPTPNWWLKYDWLWE